MFIPFLSLLAHDINSFPPALQTLWYVSVCASHVWKVASDPSSVFVGLNPLPYLDVRSKSSTSLSCRFVLLGRVRKDLPPP